MTPRADELLALTINAYEDMIRRTCDLQRALARMLGFPPARRLLDTTADLTRDVAAVQVSAARWLLDA